MNDLLLYNANIYGQPEVDIIGIHKNKIKLVISSKTVSKSELDALINNSKQVVDCRQRWVTPGLIDCHTHLVFAGNRANEFAARLKGATYQEITNNGGGINATVQATRASSFEDLIKISEQRIKQVIANGITTVEIKSGYGLNLESEKKILQVAQYLEKKYPITIQKTFLGAHLVPKSDFSDNNPHKAKEYISYLCDQVLPELVKKDLVDAVDSFCETIAFSAEELEPLYNKAREYHLRVKGHTEQLAKIGGAELICKYGGLSCDHLEYADENIVTLLKDNNVTAVLLPGAYYYLNEVTKPPIDLMRKHKVPMAIATDFNPGTSPILSLPSVMNMACVLYKLTPEEVWQGVTVNAAKALGLDESVGTIGPNKNADLIIWNFEHPNDLCYYMGYNFNKIVIKHGQIIDLSNI